MLCFLVALAFSILPYKTLTPETFKKHIQGHIPTLVRFHTHHNKYSNRLDEQFEYVGQMFEGNDGIVIASLNCGKYMSFCYEQGVPMSPKIRLYNESGFEEYDGGMSHESIAKWAAGLVKGVHPKDLQFTIRQPNGRVFREILNKTHCVFVMYYNPWCVPCKKFLPAMREVGEAFKYDDRVEIVANDVDLYKFYNWDYELKSFPDLRLYCKDEEDPIQYNGRKTADDLIDFINDYCGTQRGLNGRLNSDAGVIEEVAQIVEDYLTKGKKPMYISDMEAVEGTQYYVWVMREILEKGESFVIQEKDRLNAMLDAKTISPDKIDEFQIRVNILSVFASYLDDA